MADLRAALAGAGFDDVRTYLQSGNVVLESDLVAAVEARIATLRERAPDARDRHVFAGEPGHHGVAMLRLQ